MTITTEIVTLTPALAAEWLNSNTCNRPLSTLRASRYARDMKAGDWRFNGETISFTADGRLVDGQHRLTAVVESGVTIQQVVVHGLDDRAQETVDIGASRRLSDQLALRGEANATMVAAVARRCLLVDRGVVPSGQNTPTHAELYAFIERNPGVRRAAEVGQLARSRVPASPSAIASAYLMCARINHSDAEHFYISQLLDGLGLMPDDPARTLRRRWEKESLSGAGQMSPDDVYRYTIVAWNHYRNGGKITKLQAPHGGWANNPLPEAR